MKPLNLLDNASVSGQWHLHADGVGVGAKRRYGILFGIAISLLLHALIIVGFHWQPPRPPAPEPGQAVQALTVWLAPPPARIEKAPAAPPPAARLADKPLLAERKKPRISTNQASDQATDQTHDRVAQQAEAPSAVIALPPEKEGRRPAPDTSSNTNAANAPDAADPFAATAPAAVAGKPAFDIDAARRVARQVATERDPAKIGTAVGQIPDKPLPSETALARNIGSAKRGDCKDGIPGGLLAPLLLLLDKKDSGCKW